MPTETKQSTGRVQAQDAIAMLTADHKKVKKLLKMTCMTPR
jgi:hypothetical protein